MSKKISECKLNLSKYLAYCIPKNSFNYIHCFFKTKFTYDPLDENSVKIILKKSKKEQGVENIAKINKYMDAIMENDDGKKLSTILGGSGEQACKLEIAKFILECFYDCLFE